MKRLYRNKNNAMIGGVCSGLGTYLDIDPNIIRVFFILLIFAPGPWLIVYALLWIFLPTESQEKTDPRETIRQGTEEISEWTKEIGESFKNNQPNKSQTGLLFGAILIVAGILVLLRNFGFWWSHWINWGTLWPLILIGLGVALLIRKKKGAE